MPGERDMSRMIRQMLHKKQERTQTIQSEEPRIDDLKEGIPEFRNVRDRGVVQYIKYRDEIYSVVMEKEGLTDGVDEGAVDTSGRIDGSLTDDVGSSGLSADRGWQTLAGGLIIQWGVEGDTESAGALADRTAVVFPKTFPGAVFIVVGTHGVTDPATDTEGIDWAVGVDSDTLTTAGVTFSTRDDFEILYWIAIGH